MSRWSGRMVVCLFLACAFSAWADEPPAPAPTNEPQSAAVAVTSDASDGPDTNALCPYDECDGSGGGGYVGCYDCSSNGTTATCYTGGRYWADCAGGSICYSMSGGGWYCEPYCGRRRCYNV